MCIQLNIDVRSKLVGGFRNVKELDHLLFTKRYLTPFFRWDILELTK